jgi:hypothetical protein
MANNPPNPGAGGAGNLQPAFALSPALASDDIIDYTSAHGAKLYKSAIESLQTDLFDCDAQGITGFLNALEDRAMRSGWSGIINIPQDMTNPVADTVNLITNFGEISTDKILAHAQSYVATPTRNAQNSMQLYHCLMNSMSKAGKSKITVWKHDYNINGLPSGALLLKVIIRESHIDTRATVRHIRAKLASMSTYLPTVNYNITDFNRYVRELLDSLHARGETTQDLLANLFEAYKTAADKDFVSYIKMKENDYDEGKEVDPYVLMHQAQNKYKAMIDDKTWAAPTKEEEKIIALEAKITKLTSKKNPQKDKKKGQRGHKNKSKGKNTKNGNQDGQNGYTKPAWQTKPPTDNEKGKSKKVNKKEYWLCPHHKSWCRHKPDECRGVGNQNTNTNNNSRDNNSNKNNDRQIRLTNALETIVDGDDE